VFITKPLTSFISAAVSKYFATVAPVLLTINYLFARRTGNANCFSLTAFDLVNLLPYPASICTGNIR
jgi:hypothetical protein